MNPIASSKSFESIADRARESRSSTGPVSRPRFFAAMIRLCAREKETERFSWTTFSHRFQTFFARSIAVSKSSEPIASCAFVIAASLSVTSEPRPFAIDTRLALAFTIPLTRSS